MPDRIDIDQTAELSRLSLKPGERAKLAEDLEKILVYVDQLQELKTDGIEPTSHPFPILNVFRKDAAVPSDVREPVLRHAPKREENYFKVPKVIEDRS